MKTIEFAFPPTLTGCMPPEPLGWRVRASLAGAIPLCMQPLHIVLCFSPFIQVVKQLVICLDSFWLETQILKGPSSEKNFDGACYPGLDRFAYPMPSPEGWVKTR